MKKIFCLILSAFMLSGCSINLFGNDNNNTKTTNSTESDEKQDADDNIPVKPNVVPVSRMNTVHQTQQNLIASSYDEYFDYYIYDLGMIQDVRIDNTAYQYKEYRGIKSTETFEITYTESSSIKETCKKAGSTVVTTSESQSISVNAGTNFGKKDIYNVALSLGISETFNSSSSVSSSWEESFEKASTLTTSEKHVLTIQWDESFEQGYYIYAVIGVLNVYGVLMKDLATNDFYYDTFTTLESYSYAFFYNNESPIFKRNFDASLMFNMPELNELQKPTNYIGLDKNWSATHTWNPFKVSAMSSIKAEIDFSSDGNANELNTLKEYYNRGYTYIYIDVSFSHQLDGSSRDFDLELSFINDNYKNDTDSFSSTSSERRYYSHTFVFSDYDILLRNKYMSLRFVGTTLTLINKTLTVYGLEVKISVGRPN